MPETLGAPPKQPRKPPPPKSPPAAPAAGDPHQKSAGLEGGALPLPQQVLAIPQSEHYTLVSKDKLMRLAETERDHFGDMFWAALAAGIAAVPTFWQSLDKVGSGSPVPFWDIFQSLVFLLSIPFALVSGWVYFRRGRKRKKVEAEIDEHPQYVSDGRGGFLPVRPPSVRDGDPSA